MPALRDLDLPARAAAGRRLPRPHRPVALRPLPAASTGRASRWSCGRRRRGRCRRTSRRRSSPTPSTACATAASGSRVARHDDGPSTRPCPAASSSASPTTGRSTTSRPAPASSTGSSRGTRSPRGGHRHRPHRAGLRRRGLRAVAGARPRRPRAGRRGRPLLRRLRLAPRARDRRGRRPDRRRPLRARAARRRRGGRPPLPALLALPDAADLPPQRRLVHRRGRAPPAGCSRPTRRSLDAGLHGQAHGRLAAQHGRLEHLAQAATTASPSPSTRARAATSTSSGRGRSSSSARPGGLDQLEELRRPWIDDVPIRCEACGERGRPRIREVGDVWLDAGIVPFSTLGWENPEWVDGGLRDRRGARAHDARTSPTTPTGSSGSRPTGSRRCASRSACGSTRSSSCRSC